MAGAGLTGFLQNLSGGEMIVIVIVALVVLGPERLPELARGAGRMVHKVKTMTEGLQSEMSDVMDDPSMQPLKELGEFAARPRQKLTEYALEAEAEERSRKEAAAHEQHRAAVAEAERAEQEQAEQEQQPVEEQAAPHQQAGATQAEAAQGDSVESPDASDGPDVASPAGTDQSTPVDGRDPT